MNISVFSTQDPHTDLY